MMYKDKRITHNKTEFGILAFEQESFFYLKIFKKVLTFPEYHSII